jgi:hypothetical protein
MASRARPARSISATLLTVAILALGLAVPAQAEVSQKAICG